VVDANQAGGHALHVGAGQPPRLGGALPCGYQRTENPRGGGRAVRSSCDRQERPHTAVSA
jgi:hypothetical protein